jgi:hypothetical protein
MNTKKMISLNTLSNAALYDLYAPAVYGNILRIVPQKPIAEKVLEKVFLDAFRNRAALHNSLRAPLTNLLNHSRDKSKSILRALQILNESCHGTTASIVE